MSDVTNRINQLSPMKLALLSQRLRDLQQARRRLPRRAVQSGPAALSFAQERLWFLHQVEPRNPAYNLPGAVDLVGHLNLPALQSALNEIVRRHEVLRTTFRQAGGRPCQMAAAHAGVAIETDHLASGEPAQVERWINLKSQMPFDLAQGPLLRVHLGRIQPERHILLTVMHHIVTDGPSMNLYFQELADLYRSAVEQQPAKIPELKIQYADFSEWQRTVCSGAVLQSHLDYWKQQLAGICDLPGLPADYPRSPAVGDAQMASRDAELDHALVEPFKAMIREQGMTPFIGFLAVLQVVLHHYSGLTDIVIGSPVSGRTHAELERVIGLFANLQVLRTDLSGDPDFRELLRRVRRVVTEAQDQQDMPFQKLIEEFQPVREAGRVPLFQVSFSYFNDFEQLPQAPDLLIAPLKPTTGAAMFDLDVNIVQRQGVLTLILEYKKSLFASGTIAALEQAIRTLVAMVVDAPGLPLSRMREYLRAAEEKQTAAMNKENEDQLRVRVSGARRKVLQPQSRNRSNA